MGKKFWIAVAVMFVLGMLLDFMVHAVLLQADYLALPALYRSEKLISVPRSFCKNC